jgi:AcrR family transcriptional regulator
LDNKKVSTKQRILDSTTYLFAAKGYTETSIREMAAIVGVKEASIYNHFPSKNAILEHILEEFASQAISGFFEQDKLPALKENPTADGVLDCLTLVFPEDKAEYYLKELYVVLQEQHRNSLVNKLVTEQIILGNEQVFRIIIDKLKELNIIYSDTNPDFWVKMYSSLQYTFANRMLLGIGDTAPDFSGMGMFEMIRSMIDMMLKTCGAGNSKNSKPELQSRR